MKYHLRVACCRPQGGMAINAVTFDALTTELATAHAVALAEQLLAGRPGVAVLDSPVRGIVWVHRYRMPAPTQH
jgi:hypothetical protein